jgi:hypothetical protein
MTRRLDNRRFARPTDRKQAYLSVSVLSLAVIFAVIMLMPRKPPAVRVPLPMFVAGVSLPAIVAPVARIAAPAGRQVYPFSIVPGGVLSREELVHVVNTDSVVAEHYAGFNVDAARVVKVTKPRAVYVSYRKGNEIYWTSKKLMLAQGETLLTDGVNELRTRCGNRISESPQSPVATDEPTSEVMDSSVESMAMETVATGEILADSGAMVGFVPQLNTFNNSDVLANPRGAAKTVGSGTVLGSPETGVGPVYAFGTPLLNFSPQQLAAARPGVMASALSQFSAALSVGDVRPAAPPQTTPGQSSTSPARPVSSDGGGDGGNGGNGGNGGGSPPAGGQLPPALIQPDAPLLQLIATPLPPNLTDLITPGDQPLGPIITTAGPRADAGSNVPEPGGMGLMLGALGVMVTLRRRTRRQPA